MKPETIAAMRDEARTAAATALRLQSLYQSDTADRPRYLGDNLAQAGLRMAADHAKRAADNLAAAIARAESFDKS